MQFITVGKEVFKAARQAKRLEDAGSNDPVVGERLRKIKLVETLRKAEKDWKEVQELVGISRSTYYSWKKKLEEEGLSGLKPKPKRPKRLRQKVHWTPELLERVENLRKDNPTWGRWPIWFTLVKEGHRVSERTVGRILVHLERLGRIGHAVAYLVSVASFLARERRGKAWRKVRRPYATRKPRDYEAKEPGDLVQVDTLQITLEDRWERVHGGV